MKTTLTVPTATRAEVPRFVRRMALMLRSEHTALVASVIFAAAGFILVAAGHNHAAAACIAAATPALFRTLAMDATYIDKQIKEGGRL